MSKPATSSPHLPRLQWYWSFGDALSEADTRRLIELLYGLLNTAVLRDASRQAGMSYRAAWGLLRRCREELGLDLVHMERGKGSRLTALGASLVEMDGAARLALGEVHASWEARMRALVTPVLQAAQDDTCTLQLFASHDLALSDWIEYGRQVPVNVTWQGTEDAMAALARGECDLAGFHVPETWSAAQLAAWLHRWLKPGLHGCIPVMRRTQGLIVPRGNPLQLYSLDDVAARQARLVNRQRGSGTRSLIDQLLLANDITPARIEGYAHEEFTHDAVAATVASGLADAGFGIEAAAARYDVDFVPLVVERYGFALRHALVESPAAQTFLRRLAGETFRHRLAALPGYAPVPVRSAMGWESFLI